jgi:hypothetical protein
MIRDLRYTQKVQMAYRLIHAALVGLIGLTAAVILNTRTHSEETDLGTECLSIGGVGGLYLLAEPGELVIEIQKRDRNTRNSPTNLKAILLGPDRQLLDQIIIPDDGLGKGEGLGPVQQATLSTQVDQKGIYVINVTVTHDRYGENMLWGFSTNCSKVMIETSRGHKDARHLEPIVLDDPDQQGDICFTPHAERIQIEISDLAAEEAPITLVDSTGEVISMLPIQADGTAQCDIPEGDRQNVPWCLQLPRASAIVHIDGVTRWDRGERAENLSLWSPSIRSHFPFVDLRWMLRPYRHAFHAMPGKSQSVPFLLHNNSDQTDTFGLSVASGSLDIALAETSITLASDEQTEIVARINVPADGKAIDTLTGRVTLVSTNHPNITTWSTIETRLGQASQLKLDGPLVYKPYQHENEQFAYTPDYPNNNQIYFATDNQPYIQTDDGVLSVKDGKWEAIDTVDGERYRGATSKVAFGQNGEVCLLGRSSEGVAYLYSTDGGNTFAATPIPVGEGKRQQWDIEQFAGHNIPAGPAPFLRATETGVYDPKNFWRHENDLELFLPSVVDGKVVVGDPILLATEAIGISSHSGIPSAMASRGDRVHIVWGEATPPDGDEPGVPAYVATYDRKEGRLLGEKAFVGFGPPANDVHNTPSLVIDSQGYLHTLTGTHGQPFAYAKSLEPDTAHGGFTEPELVEEELRSTYIGFVCDPDDTLHLVFRTWKTDGKYHPESHYANLAYKRKVKGGTWEPMKRLAVAPFTEYSIWYHRLTIDRKGRLFVSFDYWSTFWFYRVDHYGNSPGRGQAGGGGRRKTITSDNGGESWKLLETTDL